MARTTDWFGESISLRCWTSSPGHANGFEKAGPAQPERLHSRASPNGKRKTILSSGMMKAARCRAVTVEVGVTIGAGNDTIYAQKSEIPSQSSNKMFLPPTTRTFSDPLSEILDVLQPSSYMFRAIDARGEWLLQFPGVDGLRCYAVTRGQIWIHIDGEAHPREIRAGGCLVLTCKHAIKLGSSMTRFADDAVGVMTAAPWGGVVNINGGGEVYGLGGFFMFEGQAAKQLLRSLPRVMQLENLAENAKLSVAMTSIMSELREPKPGGKLLVENTALCMLVLIMRQQLGTGDQAQPGWLQGLGDAKIGRALTALHAAPASPWTLASLASEAGMSRSAFAAHFRERMGEPAMGYLQRWRMLLAADQLLHSSD
ncbi:conserved hypothetical protein, partial [Ricinus communis]